MENKTCGECRYYKPYNDAICPHTHRMVMPPITRACSRFEYPTNGDVIRQMSNEELAELIVPKVIFGNGFPVKCAKKDIPRSKNAPFGSDVMKDVCTRRVEAWLNAPADCVGKDTDVPAKESEGKKQTCGECRNYFECESVFEDDAACEDFMPSAKTTVFDRITSSPEVLAEEFVAEFSIYGGRCYWCSLLLAEKGHSVFEKRFNTKSEAIAATVAKLKEVDK